MKTIFHNANKVKCAAFWNLPINMRRLPFELKIGNNKNRLRKTSKQREKFPLYKQKYVCTIIFPSNHPYSTQRNINLIEFQLSKNPKIEKQEKIWSGKYGFAHENSSQKNSQIRYRKSFVCWFGFFFWRNPISN